MRSSARLRLTRRYLRYAMRTFWTLVILVLISFAVLVQIGRLLFPYMDDYKNDIEQVLSAQLGADIEIGRIEASWKGLRPRVELIDIQVDSQETPSGEAPETIFNAQSAELEISLLSFLHDWRLAFRTLSFHGLSASFIQTEAGLWRVQGLEETSYQQENDRNLIIDDPLDIFLFGRRIHLVDTQLTFVFEQGVPFEVAVPMISLDNDDDFHRLSATLGKQQGGEFFNLVIEGYGDPRDEVGFDASGYLKLSRFPSDKVWQALDEVWKNQEGEPLLPKASSDALLDVELWTQGTLNRGFFVHGDVFVDGIPFALEHGELPQSIRTSVIGKWSREDGWRANLHQFQLAWPTFESPTMHMGFEKTLGGSATFKIDEIDLSAWQEIAVQSKWLQGKGLEIVNELAPSGSLRNIKLQLTSKDEGYFKLSADAKALKVDAWRGAPALSSVSGYIASTAYDGSILLNARSGFSMHFPKIYEGPMVFDEAIGEVRWSVDLENSHLALSSGLVTLSHADYVGKGHFNFRAPLKKSAHYEQSLTLMVGLESAPANAHRMLVPSKIPPTLYKWINSAVQSGTVTDAGFIYHGSVKKQSDLFKAIQLSMNVESADLQFSPDWPALKTASGHFYLDNNDVRVTNVSGVIQNNKVSGATVSVPSKKGILNLVGRVEGKASDALSLLAQSPVSQNVGDAILNWRAGGRYQAEVDIAVPLAEKSKDKAAQDLVIRLDQGEIDVKPARLPLRRISGELRFSNRTGFEAKKLKGRLFGEPIEVDLTTLRDAESSTQNTVLEIDFNSQLKAKDLKAWLHLSDKLLVDGRSAIKGRVRIPYDSQLPIVVTAESNLRGLASAVPAPLNKPEEADWPAELTFTFRRDQLQQQAEYWVLIKNQLEVRAATKNQSLQALSIGFHESAGSLKDNHISLVGNALTLDARAWLDYINGLREERTSNSVGEQSLLGRYTIESALSVRRVLWQDFQWDHVSLVTESDANGWHLVFENADLGGRYEHFYDGKTPRLTFNRIALPEAEAEAEQSSESEQSKGQSDAPDPRKLPALIVDAKSIIIGQQPIGSISFEVQPIEEGVILSDLKANFNGLKIGGGSSGNTNSGEKKPSELIWVRQGDITKSYVTSRAHAGDVGKVLMNWGKEEALTSQKMQMNLALEWQGAPYQATLNSLKGEVVLSLSRGRFIRGASAGENPLVKLIGLLNFDTLARRLRLDFSDLNPQGMAYEKVEGTLVFDEGRMDINRPLQVETPSSNISFVGNIDLENQRLDAEVDAILPLTGNLTVAAAVTGGLPAAVGVYLAGKLFKDQVDNIARLRYEVTGPWDAPEAKLKNAVKIARPEDSAEASTSP